MKSESVSLHKVSCEGQDQVSAHPKVYLEIDSDKNEIQCPYCSKKFVFRDKN